MILKIYTNLFRISRLGNCKIKSNNCRQEYKKLYKTINIIYPRRNKQFYKEFRLTKTIMNKFKILIRTLKKI